MPIELTDISAAVASYLDTQVTAWRCRGRVS
jgi:hypothetical protein